MKTVTVTEFKAHCLEFFNQVAKTGQCLLVTKRGKPTAMVSPACAEKPKKWVLGKFKDQTEIVGDIIAPIDVEWEVMSDRS